MLKRIYKKTNIDVVYLRKSSVAAISEVHQLQTRSLMRLCRVGGFGSPRSVASRRCFSIKVSSASTDRSISLRGGGIGMASVDSKTRDAILTTKMTVDITTHLGTQPANANFVLHTFELLLELVSSSIHDRE